MGFGNQKVWGRQTQLARKNHRAFTLFFFKGLMLLNRWNFHLPTINHQLLNTGLLIKFRATSLHIFNSLRKKELLFTVRYNELSHFSIMNAITNLLIKEKLFTYKHFRMLQNSLSVLYSKLNVELVF